jgi:hypothetical protein
MQCGAERAIALPRKNVRTIERAGKRRFAPNRLGKASVHVSEPVDRAPRSRFRGLTVH